MAVLSLGEAYAAAGTTECACKIEVTGLSESFKQEIYGVDQIQAFANAITVLQAVEQKYGLELPE